MGGEVGCLASGWGAVVCVSAGRRSELSADESDFGRGEGEDETRVGLSSKGAGAITE